VPDYDAVILIQSSNYPNCLELIFPLRLALGLSRSGQAHRVITPVLGNITCVGCETETGVARVHGNFSR